ncbi:hypothetical protein P3W24_18345 [Luteibacter sp. PPL201]|uniref:Uncharacterized protein n=1 Tax=Luteibacter sahnii TaxID=3021977 RepID=A0ABT6BG42_9GAMM
MDAVERVADIVSHGSQKIDEQLVTSSAACIVLDTVVRKDQMVEVFMPGIRDPDLLRRRSMLSKITPPIKARSIMFNACTWSGDSRLARVTTNW